MKTEKQYARRMSPAKKKAILAMLLGECILFTPAVMADSVLAVTVPSDYANSEAGTVTGSRVTTRVNAVPNEGVLKDLNRDPGFYPLNFNGESGVALRQYTYSTTNLKNSYLYTIGADGELKEIASGQLSNVPNMHAAASIGNYILGTGYDYGRIGVGYVDIAKKTITETNAGEKKTDMKVDIIKYFGNGKEPGWDDEKSTVHGEGLYVRGNNVYALAMVNPNGDYMTYHDTFLMHYRLTDTGTLECVSYDKVGKNTDTGRINSYNDYFFVSSIGGMQNYGYPNNAPGSHASINAVRLAGSDGSLRGDSTHPAMAADTECVIPGNVKNVDANLYNNGGGTDFHDMKVMPDGTAYIYGYVLFPSSEGFVSHIYQTTVSNLLSENPEDWTEIYAEKSSGWFGKLYAEHYTKRLWIEHGNDLLVFTDGAGTPTYKWEAKDFSTNKNYYQFNSAVVMDGDTVVGNRAGVYTSAAQGMGGIQLKAPDTSPNEDAKIGNINYKTKITGTAADQDYTSNHATNDYSQYTFTENTVISLPRTLLGDLKTNVLAAVDAHKGNHVTIDASDKKLTLAAINTVGNPAGIYADNGKNISIKAGKVNIITEGMEGGNSLTNAIWLDPSQSAASAITINAPVNISMSGGYGGNGIAVAKTTRFGEASYTSSGTNKITINGDVKIAGKYYNIWGIPLNGENVYSRFNNAGILTSVNNSVVDINGNIDFTIYGNGITTNAAGSKVIVDGAKIAVPKQMKYSYYSLGAYQGTINVNTGDNGNTPGNKRVVLDGDVFALNTGTINMALKTPDSYLNGIVDNGGTVNFWLQNGAQWTNSIQNTKYAKDDEDKGGNRKSYVTKLIGGTNKANAGVIYQTKESPFTRIGRYSGYTAVIYSHDGSTPSKILGGDIQIEKADTGSYIRIITDYDTHMETAAVQDAVLNALAHKLTYSEYINGVRNLNGTAEIAEGLTAFAVTKKIGNIAFDTYGKGYIGTSPEPPLPPEQNKTEFITTITGDKNTNGEYISSGVLKNDNIYHFVKEKSTVSVGDAPAVRTDKNVMIDASGKEIVLEGSGTAIRVASGKVADIKAKELKIKGNDGLDVSGKLTLTGNVDIESSDKAIQVNNGGTVSFEKGRINGNIDIKNGILDLNAAGMVTALSIKGNISTNAGGITKLNLKGKDSKLVGNISGAGTIVLSMDKEADWSGNSTASNLDLSINNSTWHNTGASIIKSFSGSRANVTSSEGDISINRYSGNAAVQFAHVYSIAGGRVSISNADAGSVVTLETDNFAPAEVKNNQANKEGMRLGLLQQMAGRLWYGNNAGANLSGKVKITKKYEDGIKESEENIFYSTATTGTGNPGQGYIIPNYTYGITGDESKDGYYKYAGVLADGIYTFTIIPSTITAEKPIAAEKDITVKTEGVRLVLKNSGGNKTAIETGKHTVTMQGGSVDTSGGNINIAGGRLNAHADTTTGNIDITGGGTVYASKNLTAERVNISGKNGNVPSKLLLIPDEKKKTSMTKVKTIKLTNGANLWTTAGASVTAAGEVTVSGGSKLGTKGTFTGAKGITVEGGSIATIDGGGTIGGTILVKGKTPSGETSLLRIQKTDITRGSRIIGESGGKINLMKNNAPRANLVAGEDSKAFFYDGGVFGGAMTATGKNALITANRVAVNAGAVIKAEKGGQINIRNNTVNKGRIIADNGTVSMTEGTFRLGDVEVKNKGRIYLSAKKKSSIEGNITIDKPSTAVLQMKGNNTVLKGNITGEGTAQLELGANGTWEGTMKTGSSKVKLGDKSVWTNTANTDIGFFNGNKAYIDMSKANKSWMKISNYSGNATFYLDHSATEKENKGLKIRSGGIAVRRAEKGSRITLRIDNQGLKTNSTNAEDKALVEGTLDNLAGKLNYVAYASGEKNLKGRVEIAEGLTSPSVSKSGDITFTKTGKGSYQPSKGQKETKIAAPIQKANIQAEKTPAAEKISYTMAKIEPGRETGTAAIKESVAIKETTTIRSAAATGTKTLSAIPMIRTAPKRNLSSVIYGDKETQMMKGSKTAMTAAALLWRGNNNDLERRMGDIRLGKEENGIWARYLGGKNELDKQKTSYKQTYNIAQAGYDKKKGNWTIGAALDYGTGKDTYASGTGKEKLASLSLYGTMQKEDGQYMDIILKGSRIKNDYTVYNEMGHRLEGKYRTNGLSLSVEYGKRMKKENGFYIDPSIEVTAGHLGGKDYDAVSDYTGGKKMHIRQDGINSVIGRIGLGIGKETERSNLFAKIALAHEFGGKVKSTFSAENEPTSGTEVDLKDSWIDVEVGGSWLLNRNTYLYGTYTRNFGADLSNKWRIDAGIRFSF